MIFQYQKNQRFFAQISEDLLELGVQELTQFNAENIRTVYRGIHFQCNLESLYRIIYHTRFITRVLAPIISFDCHSTKYLHKTVNSIPWNEFLTPDKTFAVFASVSHSKIQHSHYAALCVKDGIVDYFRDKTGNRPNVNPKQPDIWINLHLENNKAVLSLDASGGSLHRRGYRKQSGDAPMQETVAAAIIYFSGWDGTKFLYDPFCGSGTLLAEGLYHACHIPSGYLRTHFGFEHLPDFNNTLWEAVKKKADHKIHPLKKGIIGGSDCLSKAITMAKTNLQVLPHGNSITLQIKDFRDLASLEDSIIIGNPPYGHRLKKNEDLNGFYKSLGDFLKQRCTGSEAYIYFGERQWIKSIGLRPAWKKILKTGGLDGRLVKYELY